MFIKYAWILPCVLALGACTSNISPDTYSANSVGAVSSTEPATVLSAQVVNVQDGSDSNVGGLAGGAIGGVAGSSIGGGTRAHILGAIGGAVLGGIVGNKAGTAASHQQAVRYVIKTDAGRTLTLVQGPQPTFAVGQRVLLVEGDRARIIPAPK